MNEPAITAEDLTLYALHALDDTAAARVDLLLRSSSEARSELSLIRGDLAVLAMSAPQHTPPALSRQRLFKQVARERRVVPIPVPMGNEQHFALDAIPVQVPPAASMSSPAVPAPLPARQSTVTGDPIAPRTLGSRGVHVSPEERRARVRLPRIVAEPEPMFDAAQAESDDLHLQAKQPSATDGFSEVKSAMEPPAEPGIRQTRAPLLTDSAEQQNVIAGLSTESSRAVPTRPVESLSSREASSGQADSPILARAAVVPISFDNDTEDRYTPSRPLAFRGEPDATPQPRRAVVLAWAGWVSAAGLAAAMVFAVRTNTALHDRLRMQQAALVQTRSSAARADLVLQTMESAASQRFVLARQDTAPVPSARVAYLPEHGSLVFQGTNLDPLPPYKTYELWLIPKGEGKLPIPAGTFKPDSRGYATLVMPSLPTGTVAGNFGVTIEDETGSTAPTLPILLIGQAG